MTVTGTSTATGATTTAAAQKTGGGFSTLGQGDFLRLLTVQMEQQDPFDPVDNKEMLAQMAQFSSLSGITEMNATLEAISSKLDLLAAASGTATPNA
jgi:flagellar basal-body rod modification protein FlgD